MTKNEIVAKIKAEREELKTAGIIHRRDLQKHIHRMQKELLAYDRYHRGNALLAEKANLQSG
jgi:hypothetical protein